MFLRWLQNFMMGRHGTDQLSLTLLVASLVLSLLGQVLGFWPLSLLSTAGLLWSLFRTFSRNNTARWAENQKFLELWYRFRRWLAGLRDNFRSHGSTLRDRKTHCHLRCPSCGQKIRVPRGKGMIEIRCPRCAQSFRKKT